MLTLRCAAGDTGSPALIALAKAHGQSMQQFLECMADSYCVGEEDSVTGGERVRTQTFSVLELAMLPHPSGATASNQQVVRLLEEDPTLAAMVMTLSGLEPPVVVDETGHPTADVNVSTVPGTAPLYIASLYGFEGVVRMLILLGADVNAADHTGRQYCLPAFRVSVPCVVVVAVQALPDWCRRS